MGINKVQLKIMILEIVLLEHSTNVCDKDAECILVGIKDMKIMKIP